MDNIFAPNQLPQLTREQRLPLLLLFVDYEKAFNSIEMNAVLVALVKGTDKNFVEIV